MTAELVSMPLREDERTELVRLRIEQDTLARPVVDMVRELVALRELRAAVEQDMAKVARHERLGYSRIRTGAFAATRRVLETLK